MKRVMTGVIAAAVLAIAGCGDDDTTSDSANTTAEAETTTTAEGVLRTEISMIDPIDEAGYLDGLRQREPERMIELEEAELIELGRIACNLRVDRVTGSTPSLDVEMTDVMVGRGHSRDLSEGIAPTSSTQPTARSAPSRSWKADRQRLSAGTAGLSVSSRQGCTEA